MENEKLRGPQKIIRFFRYKGELKMENENFWKKWWNYFESIDLKRMQGNQKREKIFV